MRDEPIQRKAVPPVYDPCPPREAIQAKVKENAPAPPVYNPCPPREAIQAKSRFQMDIFHAGQRYPAKESLQAPISQIHSVLPRIIQAKFALNLDGKTIHILAASELKGNTQLPTIDVRKLPEFTGIGIIDTMSRTPNGTSKTLELLNQFAGDINKYLTGEDKIIVVHCNQGRHRSVLAVIYYLVKYKNMEWEAAYNLLKEAAAQYIWTLSSGLIEGSIASLKEQRNQLELNSGGNNSNNNNVNNNNGGNTIGAPSATTGSTNKRPIPEPEMYQVLTQAQKIVAPTKYPHLSPEAIDKFKKG